MEKIQIHKYNLSVLVVEDNAIALSAYATLITPRVQRVVYATDAETALQQIATQDSAFDLIFCDMQLPDGSGVELVKKIRDFNAHYRQLPIIALTSETLDTDTKRLKAHFNDWITKPLNVITLDHILHRYGQK